MMSAELGQELEHLETYGIVLFNSLWKSISTGFGLDE